MKLDSHQLNEVTNALPGTQVVPDGAIEYLYIPGLTIKVGDQQRVVDGLLCPAQHGGYTTRLFLAEPIHERGQNWSQHNIAGKVWHTWSWNNVPANLTLIQILTAHLRALR